MSKRSLYRGSAAGNPTQHHKLPSTPPSVKHPVTIDIGTVMPWFSILAFVIVAMLVAAVFSLPVLHCLYVLAVVLGFIMGGLLLNVGEKESRNSMLMIIFVVGLVAYAYLNARFFNGSSWLLVLAITVGYTIWVAFRFRDHWQQRATCGFLPYDVRGNFLYANQLPNGIKEKPTWAGFKEALRSWFSYDPYDSKSPGVYKSKSGSAITRSVMYINTVILWSGVLATPQLFEFINQKTGGYLPIPVANIFVAIGLPIALMFLVSFPILGKAYALRKHQFSPKYWPKFIHELRQLGNETEKSCLLFGRVAHDGAPILYQASKAILGGWIQGNPGSGKTVYCSQLIEQLIEQGYSVVTLDLKATSHELYYSALAAANRVKKNYEKEVPIYRFTTVHGRASHLLDIYSQAFWESASPEERVGVMLGYFGLTGAVQPEYSFFRDTSWTTFHHVLNKHQGIESFREASTRFRDELQYAKEPYELSSLVKKHGEHPRMILNRLGMVDALNKRSTYSQEVLDSSIKLEKLFQEQSVLHCALPAVIDPVGNPEAGRIILSSLLTAAANTQTKKVPVVVVIDEFQRMVGRSLDIVFQQCRSNGIGVILTNQSSADLIAVDPNMPDTILGNTAFQTWIKASDLVSINQVQSLGGKYIDHMVSRSVVPTDNGSRTSETRTETILDRVSSGLIDRVNSAQNQFFLRITDDGGYAAFGGQMFVARMDYHVSKSVYDNWGTAPWPAKEPGMLVNGEHRPKNLPPPSSALVGPEDSTPPNPSLRKRKPTQLS